MTTTAPSKQHPLGAAAQTLAGAGREAIAWMRDPANAASIGEVRARLERDARRAVMQAGKLAEAAERPMAVAVFGPSQVGKSHLISVLARKGDALMAAFDGMAEPVNYIEQINPDKGKEATGLVSRFTLHKLPAPPGFPVSLRLLSHSDVIKIIANSYFYDGNPGRYETWPSVEAIEEHVAPFVGASDPPDRAGLTVDDVWDLADYFQRFMPESELTKRLDDYWEVAAEVAPRLSIERLGQFLSILWGRHGALTELYVSLAGALAKLGFAADAFAPFEAIDATNRDVQSILDVEALSLLGQPNAPMLDIATMGGAPVRLPRAVITALTAELRIVLAEKPWDFFVHTDLLDFPGYRGRGLPATEEDEQELAGLARHLATNPAKTIQEMVLRGKVEYLFQRYVAEQEITSMLLCVKESNMDVRKLPDVVQAWVAATHGAKPQARVGKTPLLFFIFTRFDMHFEERESDRAMGLDQRFDGRMKASLLEPFGKAADSWAQQWTPDRPFSNSFLMRNPNIKNKAIFTFDGQREIGILGGREDYIAQLRSAFVSVESVNRHFVNPGKAFDEMMRFNDGGASYIAENLAKVCNPTIKTDQVKDRLLVLRDKMSDMLKRFHVSTDLEQRLTERLAVVDKVIDELEQCDQSRRFGTLLRGLMVDGGALGDRFQHALTWRDRGRTGEEAGTATAAPERPRPGAGERLRPGRPVPLAQPSVVVSARAPAPRSRERILAEATMKAWIEGMYAHAEDNAFCNEIGVSGYAVREIAAELAGAAKRLRLDDELSIRLSAYSHEERRDELTAKAVIVAETCLNRFVGSAGFSNIALSERPKIRQPDGGENAIFMERPVAYDIENLPAEAVPFRESYYQNWIFGLYQLVQDNAKSEDGQTIDVVQNACLGKALDAIAGAV